MRREDHFPICDGEVHAVVYDSERAEPVCSKCGLVLDENKLEFLMELDGTLKRRGTYRIAGRTARHSLEHQSLEKTLHVMFLQKNTPMAVQDKVLELCRTIRKQRLHRGYPVPTLSVALVYMAHRLTRVPVTLAECGAASAAERKGAARCYDRLCRKLELYVPGFESVDYLFHLAKKKKIDGETTMLASRILDRVKEKRAVRGANPIGIVAAALYLADSLKDSRITQKELASVAGISEVTIRADCKRLGKLLQDCTSAPN